jgi:predicted permease
MLRSYYNLTHEDPGFDASHSVTFHVGAAWDENRDAVGRMQRDLLGELAGVPGVTAVGFANFLPASNATIRYRIRFVDVAASTSDESLLTVGERSVTSGYFAALGATLVAGASCPEFSVVKQSGPKVLVNQRFVAAYAAGRAVVGRFIRWEQDRPDTPNTEIVGVVSDIREDNLRSPAVPYVYLCLAPGNWPDPEYVVRTAGDPRALIGAVRATVRRVASTRAVFGLMPLEEDVDATLGQTRLQTGLISAFGVAAVTLAVIGLYGLVTLAVATRRREIGIRIALGASGWNVLALVIRQGMLPALIGLAIGLAGALALTRLLANQLYEVKATDPLTFLCVTAVLLLVALAACFLPAHRAAKVDPMEALRYE